MSIEFKNPVYDVLKWLCLIVLPALSVLYSVLAGVWGWPYSHEITVTLDAVAVFIGSLIGISTYKYNRSRSGETVSTEVE